jgi:hypothetical protein
MSSRPKSTTDHDEIRRWAEIRKGYPTFVAGDTEADCLYITFPEWDDDERSEVVSWPEFFRKFDEAKLMFVYQEKTVSGKLSRLWKLVDRHTGLRPVNASESGMNRLPRRSMPSGRGRKAA